MREFLRRLRRNHILILFNIGFVITLCALLLEIDRQYYQSEKKEYIKNNWYTLFPINKEELITKSRVVLESEDEQIRRMYRRDLNNIFSKIINGPLSIYDIQLVTDDDRIIVDQSNPSKLKTYNTIARKQKSR